MYVEYTDESFTKRKNPNQTLLGPILKGRVSDQIYVSDLNVCGARTNTLLYLDFFLHLLVVDSLQVIFKNLANRPFNIYPNGLTKILPLHTSSNGKPKLFNLNSLCLWKRKKLSSSCRVARLLLMQGSVSSNATGKGGSGLLLQSQKLSVWQLPRKSYEVHLTKYFVFYELFSNSITLYLYLKKVKCLSASFT